MQCTLLGRTGVTVSRLCFGTMSFGGEADEATSAAMFHRCREVGINFFDGAYVAVSGLFPISYLQRLALLGALALLAMGRVGGGWAGVEVAKEGSSESPDYVLTNEALRVVVSTRYGGRIKSLVDRATGRDLVGLWDDGNIGGLLDDRDQFTNQPYVAQLGEQTDQRVDLWLTARTDEGLMVRKIVRLLADDARVIVDYHVENRTQSEKRLWVRNFFRPVGRPFTPQDVYFLPTAKGVEQIQAEGFFPTLSASWFAVVNLDTARGLAVAVDAVFLEQFYFWSGGTEVRTEEWVYRWLPPGKQMDTQVTLALVTRLPQTFRHREETITLPALGETPTPASVLAKAEPPFTAIPDWQPTKPAYEPTEEDRSRGFWVGLGRDRLKRTPVSELRVDVGLGEKESDYFNVMALRDLPEVRVTADRPAPGVQTLPEGSLRFYREEDCWLMPLRAGEGKGLPAGENVRVWMTVDSTGLTAGTYRTPIMVTAEGKTVTFPLVAVVHPIALPAERNFGFKPYYAISSLSGGCDLSSPKALAALRAHLDALQEIRANIVDWLANPWELLRFARIADTGERLAEVVQRDPQRITLNQLPHLDFSAFDPWIEEARKRGFNRLETYYEWSDDWRAQATLKAATGRDIAPMSDAGKAVRDWVWRELIAYWKSHGFLEIWCKISDEISPEAVPDYIESAKVVQSLGMRPYTTITSHIAQRALLINEMNPYCDEWQVGQGLTSDFLTAITRKFAVEPREQAITAAWGPYTNGGAKDTWATQLFEGVLPVAYRDVLELHVFEGDRELEARGGSPWGNSDHGVFFLYGNYLYLSLSDGADPNTAGRILTVRCVVRVPSETGEPLARLDPTDELWFYGGGSSPFRIPYEDNRRLGWWAGWEGATSLGYPYVGYGFWCYDWWQETEHLCRFSADFSERTDSPAFLGLRDGNEDAAYLRVLQDRLKAHPHPAVQARLEALIGPQETAPLRIGERSYEVYRWRDFLPVDSPQPFREAKRAVLEMLEAVNGFR